MGSHLKDGRFFGPLAISKNLLASSPGLFISVAVDGNDFSQTAVN